MITQKFIERFKIHVRSEYLNFCVTRKRLDIFILALAFVLDNFICSYAPMYRKK